MKKLVIIIIMLTSIILVKPGETLTNQSLQSNQGYILQGVANITLSPTINRVFVDQDNLYVGTTDGVHLYDISNPAFPRYQGHIIQNNGVHRILKYDNTLYVSNYASSDSWGDNYKMQAYNIEQGYEFGSYLLQNGDIGGYSDIDLLFLNASTDDDPINDRLQLLYSYQDIIVGDQVRIESGSTEFSFSTTSLGIQYDLSLDYPRESYEVANPVFINAGNTYLNAMAAGENGFYIYRLETGGSNSANPPILSSYGVGNPVYEIATAARSGNPYVALANGTGGITIAQLDSTYGMTLQPSIATPNATTVAFESNVIFSGQNVSNQGSMEIYNISSLADPIQLFDVPLSGVATQLLKDGDYLYTVQDNFGIGIYRLFLESEVPVISGIVSQDNSVILTWSISDPWDSEVLGYEIQMDGTPSFTNPTVYSSIIRTTTIPIFSNDTYYFRVRALYSGGLVGSWSTTDNAVLLVQGYTETIIQPVTNVETVTETTFNTNVQTITQISQTTIVQTTPETIITITDKQTETTTQTNESPYYVMSLIILPVMVFLRKISRKEDDCEVKSLTR